MAKKSLNISGRKLFNRQTILNIMAEAGIVTVETVLNLIATTVQLSAAMMKPPGASARALQREITPLYLDGLRDKVRAKIRLYAMLHKLKKEGLVASPQKGNYRLTGDGKDYLQKKKSIPSWLRRYAAKSSNNNVLTIIVFDVPERERAKRDWLRYELALMGFEKLQNSVWAGRYVLPSEFISDLETYGVLSYAHIFSVSRTGTITAI